MTPNVIISQYGRGYLTHSEAEQAIITLVAEAEEERAEAVRRYERAEMLCNDLRAEKETAVAEAREKAAQTFVAYSARKYPTRSAWVNAVESAIRNGITSEQAARRAAELWPTVFANNKYFDGLRTECLVGGNLWHSLDPNQISLDALAPIERELRENGWTRKVETLSREIAVTLVHLEDSKMTQAFHPDEGTARLIAAIKVKEAK
jgi:hypothetical protein